MNVSVMSKCGSNSSCMEEIADPDDTKPEQDTYTEVEQIVLDAFGSFWDINEKVGDYVTPASSETEKSEEPEIAVCSVPEPVSTIEPEPEQVIELEPEQAVITEPQVVEPEPVVETETEPVKPVEFVQKHLEPVPKFQNSKAGLRSCYKWIESQLSGMSHDPLPKPLSPVHRLSLMRLKARKANLMETSQKQEYDQEAENMILDYSKGVR